MFYSAVGGFKAVAYSDVLQGVSMFGGPLVLPVVGSVTASGWVPLMNQLRTIAPAFLGPMGSFRFSLGGVLSCSVQGRLLRCWCVFR